MASAARRQTSSYGGVHPFRFGCGDDLLYRPVVPVGALIAGQS